MKLRIDPEAATELKESAAWYEKKREGLGVEFLAAVDSSLQSIRRAPLHYAPLETVPEEPSVRRLLMDRFPYAIIFEAAENEIRVLAFAHTSRKPNYWRWRR